MRYLYKRYVDDAGSLARSKEEAVDMLDLIANQDPDRLIKWEVDYPDNPEQFTPFLSTEMRVDETGTVHHRYYSFTGKNKIKE